MLNYRKSLFWVIVIVISIIIIVGIALVISSKQSDRKGMEDITSNSTSDTLETIYTTEYDRVKVEFLSHMIGFKSAKDFETKESQIVSYIDSTIRTSLTPTKADDLDNNHTNQYRIELYNDIGGYSCGLYYDTLYDKAYLIKDGGLYEVGIDFARYIDSFLENINITFPIEDTDVVELFHKYGWTLDYQINIIKSK